MSAVETAVETYQRAVALHQLGRLNEARTGYERVLDLQPADAAALQMLGVLALQRSDTDAAIGFLEQSILTDPACAMTHIYQGIAHSMDNRHETAIRCFDRAIAIDPDSSAQPYYNRANALLQLGRYEPALDSYQQALCVGSDLDAEAHFGCGIAQRQLQQTQAALRSFERAVVLGVQDQPAAHMNRGELLLLTGEFELALQSFDQVLASIPDHAEAHFNRGSLLIRFGNWDAARTSLQQAIRCNPGHARAHFNLGLLHHESGDFEQALGAYEAAIGADSRFIRAYTNAGELLRLAGRLDEAESMLRRGLALDALDASLHVNLGNIFKDGADTDAAIEWFRRAVELDPHHAAALSTLAFSLMFTSDEPPKILAACRLYNERVAGPLRVAGLKERAIPSSARRLRVGYVSADFRRHCQSFFTIPLLENHDHSEFEIVCYSSVRRSDDWTHRIERACDTFRDVHALDDGQLASLVRADDIDILVDLAMHMVDGRPLLFARQPAPLQVAWLAYPGTTGLDTIDYRFSDARLDPPGLEEHYSERTVRLPDTFWCYDPLTAELAVNALPATTRGHLTFGCLNNPCKLTDRTLRMWAPALGALPGARLKLLLPPGRSRERFLGRARAAGIDATVVEFVDRRLRQEYLALYHDIDICLDTVPYNGHTTTLDAFWMGVPVVTRIGATCVGRGGLSLLHHLGLTTLAASTDEQFTSRVLALATDLAALARLRGELRSRLQRSPLMNGRRFAVGIEAAYRTIWQERVS